MAVAPQRDEKTPAYTSIQRKFMQHLPSSPGYRPQFITALFSFSHMLQDLSASANFEEHCQRLFEWLCKSNCISISIYLDAVLCPCCSLRVSLERMTEIQFAAILPAGRSSEPRVSPSMFKSIRWVFKQFGVQCFQIALDILIPRLQKSILFLIAEKHSPTACWSSSSGNVDSFGG